MIKKVDKKQGRLKIKKRIRAKVNGTPELPRLSVFKSNKNLYGQIIDDVNAVTLLAASSKTPSIVADLKGKKGLEKAALVGKHLAAVAKEKGIEKVVFDRNGFRYHGQIQVFADAAREGGLKF